MNRFLPRSKHLLPLPGSRLARERAARRIKAGLPRRPEARQPGVGRPITREDESAVHALAAQGLIQADIARHLGISDAAVSLLRNGKYRFSAAQLAPL